MKTEQNQSKHNNSQKNTAPINGAWLAIGTGVGTAIGVATDNIPIGVALGVAIGMALSMILKRN